MTRDAWLDRGDEGDMLSLLVGSGGGESALEYLDVLESFKLLSGCTGWRCVYNTTRARLFTYIYRFSCSNPHRTLLESR